MVSDAGTPVISDPGEEIVQIAINAGINVIPIPGACALITALIASGIDAKEFSFFGFLPINKKFRAEKLKEISISKQTIILYEAPHKLINTLKDLEKIIQDRKIVLARELTKIHEEFIGGAVSAVLEKIKEPRGEYVIVIQKNIKKKDNDFQNMTIEEHYKYYEHLRI